MHAQHGHLKHVLCSLFRKKNTLNRYKNRNEIILDEYAITTLIQKAAEELLCFRTVKIYTTQDIHTKCCELAGLFVLQTHCVVSCVL
jgi:hypothetical protein